MINFLAMTTAITSQLELGRDERVKPPQIHFDLLYKVQAEPKMKLDGVKPLSRGSQTLHAFKSTIATEARFFSPVFCLPTSCPSCNWKGKVESVFFPLFLQTITRPSYLQRQRTFDIDDTEYSTWSESGHESALTTKFSTQAFTGSLHHKIFYDVDLGLASMIISCTFVIEEVEVRFHRD